MDDFDRKHYVMTRYSPPENRIADCPFDPRTEFPEWRILSQLNGEPPPNRGTLGKQLATSTDRQNSFEAFLLRFADETRSNRIAWFLRMPEGQVLHLDKGCVGFAFANRKLKEPRNRNEPLWQIELSEPDVAEGSARYELERLERLGLLASRPEQRTFSAELRRLYENRCAVTSCETGAALEAAHIRVADGIDDNHACNGILLRADIHALFDAYLITLSAQGDRVEISRRLTDASYQFLSGLCVRQPIAANMRPSPENIADHRRRFLERDANDETPTVALRSGTAIL